METEPTRGKYPTNNQQPICKGWFHEPPAEIPGLRQFSELFLLKMVYSIQVYINHTLVKRKVGNRFILLHLALLIAIEIILIHYHQEHCDTWETFQQRSLPPPWERKNPRINRRVSVCPLWNMHKPLPQNVGWSATIPTCFWRIQLSSLESMFLLNLLRSIVTTSQTPVNLDIDCWSLNKCQLEYHMIRTR